MKKGFHFQLCLFQSRQKPAGKNRCLQSWIERAKEIDYPFGEKPWICVWDILGPGKHHFFSLHLIFSSRLEVFFLLLISRNSSKLAFCDRLKIKYGRNLQNYVCMWKTGKICIFFISKHSIESLHCTAFCILQCTFKI